MGDIRICLWIGIRIMPMNWNSDYAYGLEFVYAYGLEFVYAYGLEFVYGYWLEFGLCLWIGIHMVPYGHHMGPYGNKFGVSSREFSRKVLRMSRRIVEILSGLETKIFSLSRASQVPYKAKKKMLYSYISPIYSLYIPYRGLSIGPLKAPTGVGGMGAALFYYLCRHKLSLTTLVDWRNLNWGVWGAKPPHELQGVWTRSP